MTEDKLAKLLLLNNKLADFTYDKYIVDFPKPNDYSAPGEIFIVKGKNNKIFRYCPYTNYNENINRIRIACDDLNFLQSILKYDGMLWCDIKMVILEYLYD